MTWLKTLLVSLNDTDMSNSDAVLGMEPKWVLVFTRNMAGFDPKKQYYTKYWRRYERVTWSDSSQGIEDTTANSKTLYVSNEPNRFDCVNCYVDKNTNCLYADRITASWLDLTGRDFVRGNGPSKISLEDVIMDIETMDIQCVNTRVMTSDYGMHFYEPEDCENIFAINFTNDDITKVKSIATYGFTQ